MTIQFKEWPKIPRLNRDMVVTEKIDGTNGCVVVDPEPLLADWQVGTRLGEGTVVHLPDGTSHMVYAQSRSRFVIPDNDNHGFGRWVFENSQSLAEVLGVGYHYGEWWGNGIQRGYDLKNGDKRFSLFNTHRWRDTVFTLPGLEVVPVLAEGSFEIDRINWVLDDLREFGSFAAPGFMKPEGVIVYHTAARMSFKITLEGDEKPKGSKE